MAARLVTAPTDYPIELAQAKAHLRVSTSDEDDLILALVAAATTRIEEETRRALITQTWELNLDYFEVPNRELITPPVSFRPAVISLPRPPLQSVSWVTYIDGDQNTVYLYDSVGSPTETSALLVDTSSQPGRITPAYNGTWPATLDQMNAVAIRYVAGYGPNGDSVPAPLKSAVLLLLGHLYENREAVGESSLVELPLGVRFLLEPYRVMLGEIA